MVVQELISALPYHVSVRVNVQNAGLVVGTTGMKSTQNMLRELDEIGSREAYVLSVDPLWHAQELYISAVRIDGK